MSVFKGLSVRTVLEIYNNPDDLAFSLWERGGMWGFAICRGKEGRYKLLITSQAIATNSELAAMWLHGLLTSMLESFKRGCIKRKDGKNRSNKSVPTFDANLVDRIRIELVRSHSVDTASLFATPANKKAL